MKTSLLLVLATLSISRIAAAETCHEFADRFATILPASLESATAGDYRERVCEACEQESDFVADALSNPSTIELAYSCATPYDIRMACGAAADALCVEWVSFCDPLKGSLDEYRAIDAEVVP